MPGTWFSLAPIDMVKSDRASPGCSSPVDSFLSEPVKRFKSGYRRERKPSFEKSQFRAQVNNSFDNFRLSLYKVIGRLWRRLGEMSITSKKKTRERLCEAFHLQMDTLDECLKWAIFNSPSIRRITKVVATLLPKYRRQFDEALSNWGDLSYFGSQTRSHRLMEMIRLTSDLNRRSQELCTNDFIAIATKCATDFDDFGYSLSSALITRGDSLLDSHVSLDNLMVNQKTGQAHQQLSDSMSQSRINEAIKHSVLPPIHWHLSPVCTSCLRPGHAACRCPQVPVCFRCNRSGHNGSNCWR